MRKNININYQGAAAEANRQRIHSTLSDKAKANAGKEISVTKDGVDVMLTLTGEYIEFKEDTCDFFERDINVKNSDPDDVFSFRPKDQWLVFSQFLYDEGFFSTLSIDVINKMETLLQNITNGLDSITQQGIDLFGGDIATQLESYEARLELASSASALAFFSDKYLTGNTKQGFDDLVTSYMAHNENKLENYQSIEEKFYAARAKLNNTFIQISPTASNNVSVTNKLGGTKFSAQEWKQTTQKAASLFAEIENKADIPVVLETVREELLQFCLKGISKNDADFTAAHTFINSKMEDTFVRVEQYWNRLL